MLGYSDIASDIASKTSESKSITLRILLIKSSVSLINDDIVGQYGGRKTSTIFCIPSVAEPHAVTTGLPGSPFYVLLDAGKMCRISIYPNGGVSNIISNNFILVELTCKMLNVFLYVVDGGCICP